MIDLFLDNSRELSIFSILIRILLALLIGGIVGIERGRKNRPAGFRTYILVCLGSALVMMTNQYVYQTYQLGDPVRLGAQVISGIGFLGAGTIMMTRKNQIKGLTTAAGLWTAACCGLAIGIGFYEGAVFGGIAILFVISGLQNFDTWMRKRSKYLDIYLEYDKTEIPFHDFLQYAKDKQIDITNIQVSHDAPLCGEKKTVYATGYILTVHTLIKRTHAESIDVLAQAEGVQYIEEL